MGLVRLVLALAVVVSHGAVSNLYGFRLVQSSLAVQGFFILSGFYMALVLDTTYTGERYYRAFLTNRALRLYPIYWTVALITLPILALAVARGLPSGAPDSVRIVALDSPIGLNAGAVIAVAATNVAMIGQDVVHFFVATPGGGFGVGGTMIDGAVPMYRYLVVPQAWTLSFEMLFYATAPFLVRRHTTLLIALVVASLLLRLSLYKETNLMGPPAWEYKFLPAQLWTFIVGLLAYRLYRAPRFAAATRRYTRPALCVLVIGVLFTAYGGSALHGVHPLLGEWLVLPGIALLVPVAFAGFDRESSSAEAWGPRVIHVDRALGDLSYAVYIAHVLIYLVIYAVLDTNADTLAPHITVTAVLFTLAASWILVRIVGDRVEPLRARRRLQATHGPVATDR